MKTRRVRVAAIALLVIVGFAVLWLRTGPTEEHAQDVRHAQVLQARRGLAARMSAYRGPPLNVARAPGDVLITGTVTNSKAEPLAEATLCAACASCDSTMPGSRPRCVSTGTDGRYALRALPTGTYRITASAMGYESAVVDGGKLISIHERGLSRSGLDVALREGGAVLAGIVTDATGGPIAGATVQVNSRYAEGQAVSQTASSDESGAFSLSVRPGPVMVLATAEGYASAGVTRYAPARDVRLVMTPPASIAGRVVTEHEGRPVAGAEVRAWSAAGTGFAVSNEQGEFALRGLRPGTYQLEAQADGVRGQHEEGVSVDLLEDKREVVIAVRAAPSVRGMVRLGDAPCELAEVVLQPTKGESRPIYARASPDGSVVVQAVPPGSYQSSARCAGFGASQGQAIDVGQRDVSGVAWQIPRGQDVTVRAVNADGSAVAALTVRLDPAKLEPNSAPVGPRTGLTDEQGSLVFRGVGEGEFLLYAQGLSAPIAVAVSSRHSPETVVLKLNAVGFIDVTVTTPSGVPNDEVAVSARPSDGGPSGAVARPRGNGHYRVGPVAAGSYRVEVRDGVNPLVSNGADAPVQVQLGQTTEVQLTFGGYRGVIRGRVVTTKDEPVENVWVSAAPAGAAHDGYGQMLQPTTQAEARRALTDSEGLFELKELNQSGTFTISATRPLGGEVKLDNVRVGQSVVLSLDG